MLETLNILFFDLEVHPKSKKILEYGAMLNGNEYRGNHSSKFQKFSTPASILCGHNIIAHDLPILKNQDLPHSFFERSTIDTLYLSVLLFPKNPYHPLVKDYQIDGGDLNNPLADARLTKELLTDLVGAFHQLPKSLQKFYYSLLIKVKGFNGFFNLLPSNELGLIEDRGQLIHFIKKHFKELFCRDADLLDFIENHPIELAFALAIITVNDSESLLPPWVKHQFPETLTIINALRIDCQGLGGCPYCHNLDPVKGLNRFFGYENFRHFEGDGEIPLQQEVVEAALAKESLLAIFPTGGGKSLTFQLPALMNGVANRSLTVIISPLQSLMKDQVDVLQKRFDITAAVAINGLLSPLERGDAIKRVESGGANLLYISPESLRSRTIMRLLKKRLINRFVIDEAHCFSAWGQDFRVDYLYIAKFLKRLQNEKGLLHPIPVSCFTATAKPAVIIDIQQYFKKHLTLNLMLYQTSAKRKNLHYFVIKTSDEEDRLLQLMELLQSEEGPKIVYVSRVKRAEGLAEDLGKRGIVAKAYHGKLERDEKTALQDEFMSDEGALDIIVATSAFGMGVDKDNIKMVIHYNISNSLENYMQESGRAGRQSNLQAKCYVLYNEEDLDAHFHLLNLTKLSHKEVFQIWQGIKRFKAKKFTKSALEIAKRAGWDTEINDLETRVKTALSTLEESGYMKREENAPQIFAQSILAKNVEEAKKKMDAGIRHFTGEAQYKNAQRIYSSLISRAKANEDTRVDYIAESLELDKNEVTRVLNIFKQQGILSNDKDLTAYYYTVQGKRNSINRFNQVKLVEQKLFEIIFPNESIYKKDISLREVNETINNDGIECDLVILKDLLNYWQQVHYIIKNRIDRANNRFRIVAKIPFARFKEKIDNRLTIGTHCLAVLRDKYLPEAKEDPNYTDRMLIEFSVLDLKNATEENLAVDEPIILYEFILLYFHHLKIFELKDGLMVYYSPMKITREVDDTRKQYTKDDYAKLEQYYQSKTEQIHIVGEYAKKQLENNISANLFVEDYFTLSYEAFIKKYFSRRKGKIKRTITEKKFARIITDLSPQQLEVVKDGDHNNIMVAAGPGAGKTRVLVHKVAALLLMEDVKPDQFLMLTFSRPAALEFKNRLKELIGNIAYHIDIFTYHGFAFQLMGRMGDIERSQDVLEKVVQSITAEEIPLDRIQNKSVIVIDEYQDVSEAEYKLIVSIIKQAGKIRVIAAGDDDQNIYEFRGSSIKYMRNFITDHDAHCHYLTKNYRAKYNLLLFTNRFLEERFSSARMKVEHPLVAHNQNFGTIEITKYPSDHLIVPLVEQIKKVQPQGIVAVLTHTNNEAVLITSLLKQEGFPAKLIVDKDGFSLRQLLEIEAFTHHLLKQTDDAYGFITEDHWEATKKQLLDDYTASANLDLASRIIESFHNTNPKKFKTEWLTFLKESKIEDFYHPEKSTILVSTMHKSKGKEFDHVFVLLNNFQLDKESQKRVLYVAMTRAKTNLYLHTNNLNFSTDQIPHLTYTEDKNQYPALNTIIIETAIKDIYLGFSKRSDCIYNTKAISSGARLIPQERDISIFQDENKNVILKLSRTFEKRFKSYLEQGYELKQTTAKYIVLWYDEELDKKFRVVLPELVLVLVLVRE